MVDMTPAEMDQLLIQARIGRLCMADAAGRPYAIPLPFYWDGRGLYVRLPLTGRKGQVLSENDRVCFEVDEYSDTLDYYASVLIEGRLVEVKDVAEKLRIKLLNTEKYQRLRHGHRPGHGRARPLVELPLRKIAVETISGRRKEDPVPTPENHPA